MRVVPSLDTLPPNKALTGQRDASGLDELERTEFAKMFLTRIEIALTWHDEGKGSNLPVHWGRDLKMKSRG